VSGKKVISYIWSWVKILLTDFFFLILVITIVGVLVAKYVFILGLIMLQIECWKQIPDTNYEVSASAKVRHIKSHLLVKIVPRGKQPRQDYPSFRVRLVGSSPSKKKHFCLHQVVAHAWLPVDPQYETYEVGHILPDRYNCVVSNLAWTSRKENNVERYERNKEEFEKRRKEDGTWGAFDDIDVEDIEHPFGV